MCKSLKMRVSKRLILYSIIIYGGAEARLRGVLEPPEPPPVHATEVSVEIVLIKYSTVTENIILEFLIFSY